jgi:multicomponent Na+:H+ antiporter subunit E
VLIIWLTLVWVLLWSDLTLANVLAGLLVATVLTTFLQLNPVPFHARLHPRGFAVLLGTFVRDIVLASVQVAFLALRRRRVPRGAVLRVRLRSHSDVILTMTAELCSLVPGSIVIEAHRLTGTLYVHLLDAELAGGLARAREHVLEQERRLLYALAAPEEIAEAGLPPRPSRRHVTAGRSGTGGRTS